MRSEGMADITGHGVGNFKPTAVGLTPYASEVHDLL